MKTIVRVILSLMLAGSVALAQTAPPTPTAADRKVRRLESFKDWWLWSLVAVLSAGTIITAVVITTVPRGSLNTNPPVGEGAMAVTVRF